MSDVNDAAADFSAITVSSVLIVEDDPGDALLVQELLAEALPEVATEVVARVADATDIVGKFDCAIVDLGLPDASGVSAVSRLVEAHPTIPVIVLTGATDEILGVTAVAAGAQDYLVKGRVEPDGLRRSVRYAVQRRHSLETARQLFETEQRRSEQQRLERGLLPHPMISEGVRVTTRYQPATAGELGGDFFDALEDERHWLRVAIGDVAGHGPDEAALGVCSRVAWRALTIAGLDQSAVLSHLEQVLRGERAEDDIFATMAVIEVHPDHRHGRLWLAGHPPPLLLTPDGTIELPSTARGVMLGAFDDGTWPAAPFELPPRWRLLLFTDGLIEGRDRFSGSREFGIAGVRAALEGIGWDSDPDRLLDRLLAIVEDRNGGPMDDDIAVCLVDGEHR